ncbi:hypothetical protein AVEN_110889-1 [Araneus ventricosus]|uniref:Uncharacterized protein n=1 Tax=Araneus ventricosus TaxID=182803 RepID=A0A4Y2PUH5_ARAVE|nr:hypothetical protein AVEN_110889-1 [Araneus ventricosus]
MACFQRAIHRSSTVEFLEHGKVKPVVSFKNRWKSAQMEENDRIPNSLKAEWKGRVVISGPRCEASGKTTVLPSLGLRDEGHYSKFLVSSGLQVTRDTISSSPKTSQHSNVESSLIHCSTASLSTFLEQSNWSLTGLKVGWTSPIQYEGLRRMQSSHTFQGPQSALPFSGEGAPGRPG